MGSHQLNELYFNMSDTTSETTTMSRCSSIERFKLPEGHIKQKFKVDRRKLEAMILGCPPDPWETEVMKIPIGNDGRVMPIEEFFQRIMDTTNTEIKYPKCLDIGARNRKDPYIHIIGNIDDVGAASAIVLHNLQPQLKVIMKLDIPYTAHSHIIGKGGSNIQAVVKKTGVSIHFPDGNKNPEVQKCNQVSINSRGQDLNGLESARASLRELTPLIFSFKIQASFIRADFLSGTFRLQLKNDIESKYHVQVECLYLPCGMFEGLIKGVQSDAERLMEATKMLLLSLCGMWAACQMCVEAVLHISEQHQSFVLGTNSHNIKRIMHKTTTEIIFPDLSDPDLCTSKRSIVIIRGGVTNVYAAIQKVIGSLPLVLMFDILPDHDIDHREILQIKQSLDVHIDLRHKRPAEGRPEGRCSIKIKGEERNASNIYEAWRQIAKVQCDPPKMKIPHTYFFEEVQPPNYSELCPMDKNTVFNNNIGEEPPFPLPPCSEKSFRDPPIMSFEIANGGEDQKNFLEANPDPRAVGSERRQKLLDYEAKKTQAWIAMKRDITPTPRIPNSEYSGYNFSRSCMPGFSNILQNTTSLDPLSSSGDSSSGQTPSFGNLQQCPTRNISASNFGPLLGIYKGPNAMTSQPSDVESILNGLQLQEYIDIFSGQGIDKDLFLTLEDDDLKELGVHVFGQRKKLLRCIKNLAFERRSFM